MHRLFSGNLRRALKELVDLDKLALEAPSSIRAIWNEYHAATPYYVSTILDSEQWETVSKRMEKSPYFMFPVIRQPGHFLLFSEVLSSQTYFYHTAEYKSECAEPYLTVFAYEELVPTKDIVLIRGQILNDSLSKREAEALLLSLVKNYSDNRLYKKGVEPFNHDPQSFDYETVLSWYLTNIQRTYNKK